MSGSQFAIPPLSVRGHRAFQSKAPAGAATPDGSQEMAAAMLERTGSYRIQRRLQLRAVHPIDFDALPADRKLGLVLDTETTGLDPKSAEIIELGMVAFTFDDDCRIGEVIGVFGGLREPSVPLTQQISRLTGITFDMVAGQSIDVDAVTRFARRASVVVAHNAQFDRPFAEKTFPVFKDVPWACSLKEVDWKCLGSESGRLGHLLADIGLFHGSHRAVDDCHALLEILAHPRQGDGTAFERLMRSARSARVEISAQGSPFAAKDVLKARGYRWFDGSDGGPKSWRIDVLEEVVEAEIRFLREWVYRSEATIPCRRLDATTRYR